MAADRGGVIMETPGEIKFENDEMGTTVGAPLPYDEVDEEEEEEEEEEDEEVDEEVEGGVGIALLVTP